MRLFQEVLSKQISKLYWPEHDKNASSDMYSGPVSDLPTSVYYIEERDEMGLNH